MALCSLPHQLRSCSGSENVCWLPGTYKITFELFNMCTGMWFNLSELRFPVYSNGHLKITFSERFLGLHGERHVLAYNGCLTVFISFPALSSQSEPNLFPQLRLLSTSLHLENPLIIIQTGVQMLLTLSSLSYFLGRVHGPWSVVSDLYSST